MNIYKIVEKTIELIEENLDNYDFECYSEGDTNSDDYVSGIWVVLKLK